MEGEIRKKKNEIKKRIKSLHPDLKKDFNEEDKRRLLDLIEELERLSNNKKLPTSYKQKIINRARSKKRKLIELIKPTKDNEIKCMLCSGTGRRILGRCDKCNGMGTIFHKEELRNGIKVHSLELCPKCYGLRCILSKYNCPCCNGKGKIINTE